MDDDGIAGLQDEVGMCGFRGMLPEREPPRPPLSMIGKVTNRKLLCVLVGMV